MGGTVRVRTVASLGLAVVVGFVVAVVVLWAMRVDAAPGDTDTTFVPVAPCRLADTRPVPDRVGTAGSFAADDTKVFVAHGVNGKCTLPADAVGLSLNVTAVGASAPTFITVWGEGVRPTASSLNPSPGQPPVPNAVVTPLSGSGSFRVYNLAGRVDVIVDVNGYYTKQSLVGLDGRVSALESAGVPKSVLDRLNALESDVAALEAENAAQQAEIVALQAKTASMSVVTAAGQPTVRFSGVNVQVVSGSGATDGTINGRGNLIVGYNEFLGGGEGNKSGSHNVVIGRWHQYSSHGGLVAGLGNDISGPGASVTGGSGNTASGQNASVSGGVFNAASGSHSSVSGGSANVASGLNASVSGGANNQASARESSVSGGLQNAATSGRAASVSGGVENVASGPFSSVSGGYQNTVSGRNDAVAGGDNLSCLDPTTGTQSVVCGEGTFLAAD